MCLYFVNKNLLLEGKYFFGEYQVNRQEFEFNCSDEKICYTVVNHPVKNNTLNIFKNVRKFDGDMLLIEHLF